LTNRAQQANIIIDIRTPPLEAVIMASDITICPSERQTISLNSLVSLFLAAALAFILASSPVWAAPPAGAKQNAQQTDPDAVAPGQIGNSGFVVPIPEIKMKSIIGNQPAKKPQHEAPPVKERPAMEQPPALEESDSLERAAEFDEPPPPAESTAVAPAKKREQPAESREETREPDQVKRLPFDPEYRTGPSRAREVGPPPVQAAPQKMQESPLASPPVAPEETIEAPPLKKEVLKGKVTVTPPSLLEATPVKGSAKTTPIERMTIDRGHDSDSIPFAERKALESIPAEPAKVADISRPEPPAPEPTRMEPPAPQLEPEPVEEEARPEEPTVEQPSPLPVRVASPLDPDALRSRDVKDYLTQTSPILEELSLLMTRAPSLAIADFDPSDPNAVIFPKEIYIKIDSMKRALQVLDSKAFAIIPPAKYAPFHSVIRESIIQTYQACDAMINYFNERSDENLQKVHNHLMKARELVQKTHLAQG
jgi:hypothetical protein